MLIARPIPWPDEAPASIFMRAASANGYQNVNSMLRSVKSGSDSNLLWRSPTKYQEYADVFGIEIRGAAGAFRPYSSYSESKLIIRDGIHLPRDAYRDEGSAACPVCLQCAPYLRRMWSVKFINTCSIHGCKLIRQCQQCGMALSWNRKQPHICPCGFDLCLASRVEGNRHVAQFVIDAINNGEQKKLDSICAVFTALNEARSGTSESKDEDVFTTIAIRASQDDPGVVPELAEWVKYRVNIEHPRLTLLPFLRKEGRLYHLALSVLSELNHIDIPIQSESPPVGILTFADSATALGANKFGVVSDLNKLGILERAPMKKAQVESRYTRSCIDSLLRRLWRPISGRAVRARNTVLTTPIASLAKQMLDEPSLNAGYDLQKGLFGLRALNGDLSPSTSITGVAMMNVEDAAKLLGVYPPVVRSLMRSGYLTPHKDPKMGRRILLAAREVEDFNRRHIFPGALARSVGASPTRFVEKLHANGVKPVGGPGIDGLLVYLLRREDVESLDLLAITLSRKFTRIESRQESKWFDGSCISISMIAAELGIPIKEVVKLVRKGVLTRVKSSYSAIMVDRTSFERFNALFSRMDLVEVNVAAARLGENIKEFWARWVTTEIVEVLDLGVRRCIQNSDFRYMQRLKRNFMTAKEAAREADCGKFFFPNLESQGLITSKRLGKNGQLRLFSRKDVQRVLRGYSN